MSQNVQSLNTLPSAEYMPDLREVVGTIWRHRRLALMISGAVFALGCVGVMLSPASYKASATVMVEDDSLNLSDFQDVTEASKFDDLTIQTEVKMLSSQTLAQQTIAATRLAENEEFSSSADDPQKVVSAFARHLSISPQGPSRVIEVTFKAHDPEFAAKVANTHVDNYLKAQIEYKKQKVEQLRQWFQSQVKDLKADVLKKSQAVSQYRANENLAVGKDNRELVYQQISDIAAQLVPLQVHKYQIEARLQSIVDAEKSGTPDAVYDIVNSPLIQNLKEQRSAAQADAQSLRSQYGAKHPKLAAAQNESGSLSHAIEAEVKNIKASLENDRIATDSQIALLNTNLDDLKKQADNLREKMIDLNSLVVEQDASQKLLDTFLANYENIQSQSSFARPDAVLVSAAVAPAYPAGLGKKAQLMGVLFFSILVSLGTIFVLEMMRGGLCNFDDIRKLRQKPLGIMPLTKNPAGQALSLEGSSTKEAMKRIYMSCLMGGPSKIILVTSALPQEGRTTFIKTMSNYLLSIGHRVLVIDADFLKPRWGELTLDPDGPGFANLLSGKIILPDGINLDENGLSIIHAGQRDFLSPDVFLSQRLRDILAQLRDQYSYIFIDSGPMLSHSESEALARQVDGVIVLAEWMKTSVKDVTSMLTTLEAISAPVMGMVINKVDIEKYKVVTPGSDFLIPRMSKAA